MAYNKQLLGRMKKKELRHGVRALPIVFAQHHLHVKRFQQRPVRLAVFTVPAQTRVRTQIHRHVMGLRSTRQNTAEWRTRFCR